MPSREDANFEDPKVERRWIGERRLQVVEYMKGQAIRHGPVAVEPAWRLAPITSVWGLDYPDAPGLVGWWAVCGDHITDHVTADEVSAPREVLMSIAERWMALAEVVGHGGEHPEIPVGGSRDWQRFSSTLRLKAKVFAKLAADETVWRGEQEPPKLS